jgi:hypothetical protein
LNMVVSCVGLRYDDDGPLGAQTVRRGGAGPAGACFAVRTPPAAWSHYFGSRFSVAMYRPSPGVVEKWSGRPVYEPQYLSLVPSNS